jgi:predicted dinucleotide-binding enzyme
MEVNMKIGVLGSGNVAKVLASGFLQHGHETMVGTRDSAKLMEWAAQNPRGKVGSFDTAAVLGDVVVLAVKGTAATDALRAARTVSG